MKKLIVLLMLVQLLSITAFADYVEGDHYNSDGIPYVEVIIDGELHHMTESEFAEYVASQNIASVKSVSEVVESSPEIFYDASLVDEGLPYASELQSDVRTLISSGAVPPSESSEGTMKYVVQSIFGDYEPVEEHITVYLQDGTAIDGSQVVQGISGVDWAYISGVALFALCLAALFKLLRVVIGVV